MCVGGGGGIRTTLPPDNSPLIFNQLAARSFIHYRAKRVAKYMNPKTNRHTNYSSFFYPLPNKLFFVLLSNTESEDWERVVWHELFRG